MAAHPEVIGLPKLLRGETEHPLPSGDALDVFFERGDEWIAVEVKSVISPEADITRGMFQCVKYLAVLEAWQAANGMPQDARAVLVLESGLPESLNSLKNILGVEVVEDVKPV